ncbi:hypothetical protein B5M42_002335 [Paenibacillus athensensis]|uniref:Membrane-anchored protein n=1 Tax=Paenibacillus athensensis TaxID=1967502 RepID=A0A4Y8QC51_9BACL|nr:hypothetical protein [Paenibacillus athensensis]MCD1257677.1 hypothetical protein [Paenibacillus athensensis]
MNTAPAKDFKQLLSKVPEVTIYFWIIKVLCTTVGETAADFLNVTLGLGLSVTSLVVGVLLVFVLFMQFRAHQYIPVIYWLSVFLISIFGTLVTDNLTDNIGVPLEISTLGFSVVLILLFSLWFKKEKTLSIHSIVTRSREAFYWLIILFTFALGTAVGDLMAESLALGYLGTGLIVILVVACMALAWRLGLNAVLTFWIVYVSTRPLGASIGDYLSQPKEYGGLDLGATITSAVFVAAIALIVIFLSITKRDVIESSAVVRSVETNKTPFVQVAVVLSVLVIAGGAGYYWRQDRIDSAATQVETSGSVSPSDSLGDLSNFRSITEDTLNLVNADKLPAAKTRVADLEHDWDSSQSKLKPKNKTKWNEVDGAIDHVLKQLRASKPDSQKCKTALEDLLVVLQ